MLRVASPHPCCGGMLEPLRDRRPGCGADVLCVQEVTWTPGHDGWVTDTDLVGDADTRTSVHPEPVRHADHLLICDQDTVASFEVVTAPEVSDHRPLVLDPA